MRGAPPPTPSFPLSSCSWPGRERQGRLPDPGCQDSSHGVTPWANPQRPRPALPRSLGPSLPQLYGNRNVRVWGPGRDASPVLPCVSMRSLCLERAGRERGTVACLRHFTGRVSGGIWPLGKSWVCRHSSVSVDVCVSPALWGQRRGSHTCPHFQEQRCPGPVHGWSGKAVLAF